MSNNLRFKQPKQPKKSLMTKKQPLKRLLNRPRHRNLQHLHRLSPIRHQQPFRLHQLLLIKPQTRRFRRLKPLQLSLLLLKIVHRAPPLFRALLHQLKTSQSPRFR